MGQGGGDDFWANVTVTCGRFVILLPNRCVVLADVDFHHRVRPFSLLVVKSEKENEDSHEIIISTSE